MGKIVKSTLCFIVWITFICQLSRANELEAREKDSRILAVQKLVERNNRKKSQKQLRKKDYKQLVHGENLGSAQSNLLVPLETKVPPGIKLNLLFSDSPCFRVNIFHPNEEECLSFENLPLDSVHCESGKEIIVPKIYHAIGNTEKPSYSILSNAYMNPGYRLNYHNDASAKEYIRKYCGEEIAKVFECLMPSAYRADLFRFCAMYAEGGLYLDADLISIQTFETLYSPCAPFSLGHDFSFSYEKATEGKQMKIIASQPQHQLSLCMIQNIAKHVKERQIGKGSLSVSGPLLLAECYSTLDPADKDKVAITYLDTRQAAYPYTGMRTMDSILAFEVPMRLTGDDSLHYSHMYSKGNIYRKDCPL